VSIVELDVQTVDESRKFQAKKMQRVVLCIVILGILIYLLTLSDA
jgi:hypothetical protein